MNETQIMIEALQLTTPTDNPRLQSAREHALRCLRSKTPIPKTVMDIVERGAASTTPSTLSEVNSHE